MARLSLKRTRLLELVRRRLIVRENWGRETTVVHQSRIDGT